MFTIRRYNINGLLLTVAFRSSRSLIGCARSRDIYRLETHLSATSIWRVTRLDDDDDWIDRSSSVSRVWPQWYLASRRRAVGLKRGRQTKLTVRGEVVSVMQWRRQVVIGLREKHTSSTPCSLVRSSFTVFSFLQNPDNTASVTRIIQARNYGWFLISWEVNEECEF